MLASAFGCSRQWSAPSAVRTRQRSSFLDRVVGHHITELTAQGAITPADTASLIPRFAIAESVTDQINAPVQ